MNPRRTADDEHTEPPSDPGSPAAAAEAPRQAMATAPPATPTPTLLPLPPLKHSADAPNMEPQLPPGHHPHHTTPALRPWHLPEPR